MTIFDGLPIGQWWSSTVVWFGHSTGHWQGDIIPSQRAAWDDMPMGSSIPFWHGWLSGSCWLINPSHVDTGGPNIH